MMPQPLVSVVLPVHNGQEYVRQAVESVLSQTDALFELIVVNDGSVDRSEEIVRAFGDRVHYVVQPNMGAAAARNRGLEIAQGDLLAFIDADDLWLPDKLLHQTSYLDTHPTVEYCVGKIRHFLEPGKSVPRGFKAGLLERDVVGRLFGTLLARRTAFDRLGCFNADLSIAHDVEWFVRAEELQVSMGVLDEVVMLKRVHEDNISNRAAANSAQLLSLFRQSIKRRSGSSV